MSPPPCRRRRTAHDRRALRSVWGTTATASGALLRANLRFWRTVAPLARRELSAWHARASLIPDAELRGIALEKLRDEDFNAQVAATLATLAPSPQRSRATRAIVAYEVMYDYLDGLTERPSDDHLDSKLTLYRALRDAVSTEQASPHGYYPSGRGDGGYLQALCETTRANFFALPRAQAVASTTATTAGLCAESQARVNAVTAGGSLSGVAAWAVEQSAGSGLGWREWLAGAVASVLGVHALISVASLPSTSASEAKTLSEAYLAVSALSTMLDSLVDRQRDDEAGASSWLLRCYDSDSELTCALTRTSRYAAERVSALPHGAHHLMTMTGVVSYYTSAPTAKEPRTAPIVQRLHSELGATLVPTLAIMRAWRAGKKARPSRAAA